MLPMVVVVVVVLAALVVVVLLLILLFVLSSLIDLVLDPTFISFFVFEVIVVLLLVLEGEERPRGGPGFDDVVG